MNLPTIAEIEAAADLVHRVVPATPQICWPLLCERVGAEVWVKHENHTRLGAFKVRGGLTYMADLRAREPDVQGVIAATRGNHGQSVAFAASNAGLRSVIVVPHGNSREKNASMKALGAELIEHGDDFQDALLFADGLAAREGLHFVPALHESLIRGVASYSLELFTAVPEIDTLYVPIGMGSGICSAITVRNALGLRTEIVGVVAEGAPTYALSLAAGKPVASDRVTTRADGLAVRVPDPAALEIIRAHCARLVVVSDDEIEAAMRILFTDTHNVAEGAGAASLAGLIQEASRMKGKRVAVVQSGGNIDRERYAEVLAGTSH